VCIYTINNDRDSDCSSVYTYSTYMAEVAVVRCVYIQYIMTEIASVQVSIPTVHIWPRWRLLGVYIYNK